MPFRSPLAAFFAAFATGPDPFDVARVQRFDERGVGLRVPRHDAFAFQVRFGASDAGSELNTDPQAATEAVAPPGCIAPQDDGVSYRVEYACQV